MRLPTSPQQPRRGALALIGAVLMMLVLAMVAFSVDFAWIVETQSDLQNAADAAALAGAQSLMDGYISYSTATSAADQAAALSTSMSAARSRAITYAGYNSAGGVKGLTLKDSDIEFGFRDAQGIYWTSYAGFPNTLKVTLRRDNNANGPLKLFFGGVLGTQTTTLTATASATINGGDADSLASPAFVLPMTYDVDHWDAFLGGKGPPEDIVTDSNGDRHLIVYSSTKDKGNFGELSLNDSHTGASVTSDWINNGISAIDRQSLINSNLIPLSRHDPNLWNWCGNNGFRASNVMDVNARSGNIYVLPLFKAKNSDPANYQAGVGKGSTYDYNIVRFAAVRITTARGENRYIQVQPVAVIDPSTIFDADGVAPAGTQSHVVSFFVVPKLTR